MKDNWWYNCKADRTGGFLYDIKTDPRQEKNLADEHSDVTDRLFDIALKDAGGTLPEWLVKLAVDLEDAPGCSQLAARK